MLCCKKAGREQKAGLQFLKFRRQITRIQDNENHSSYFDKLIGTQPTLLMHCSTYIALPQSDMLRLIGLPCAL